MFSGIVEKGKILKKEEKGQLATFTIKGAKWRKPLKKGESIAVNGVCLSVVRPLPANQFVVQAVHETLAQTNLRYLKLRDEVNLERSLTWGDRISGHFVLGHVDGVGKIIKKKKQGSGYTMAIEIPHSIVSYLIPKGSIAVDGISLTIQSIKKNVVTIAIIPLTAKTTSLGKKDVDALVNLEADVISKHLSQMVHASE